VTTPDSPEEAPHIPAPAPSFSRIVPPICLPIFLGAADATVVATALPAIAATFGEVEHLSWIVVFNLVASTIAAPAYGRLGDAFGRRRMMFAALCIFAAATCLCAAASSFPMLLAARALQGIGGGGLMTLAQALVGEHVPPRKRGTYQGYISANIVAGSTLGPVLGGFLNQTWGWQAVFLGYLPVSAIALVLVFRLPVGVRGGSKGGFDLPGLGLLTACVVPLLLTVSQLQRLSVAALPGLGGLAALTAAALAALLWQQRRAAAPLLPLALLRNPTYWRAIVMGACSGGSLAGMVTFLPIYLQVVAGASPAETGLLLIPLTGAVSLGSMLTGWIISHTGRTAIFPSVGLVITALSLVALAAFAPSMTRLELSWMLALGGLAQGSAMVTAQLTGQAAAGPRQLGAASAAIQLARSLGSAFGAATAGAVLFGLLSAMDHDTAGLFAELVRRGSGAMDGLDAVHRIAAQAQIGNAFRGVFLTVACFSCTIAACAATMPMRRL
jgi:MFS family permease